MTTKELLDDFVKRHIGELKSFLYRFTTSREDAEDIAQDALLKAYQRLDGFQGKSTLKTWVFAIAVNLAKDNLKAKKRWSVFAQDHCKSTVGSTPSVAAELHEINATSQYGKYEINEHIDFCFTCISKSLIIEQQLALMLADIYEFKVKEISEILNKTTGVVKHLLINARTAMQTTFDSRCALINKQGVCHQCSELNGFNNSKAETQKLIVEHELAKAAQDPEKYNLFVLRTELVKAINPLESKGLNLHDFLMQITHKANG